MDVPGCRSSSSEGTPALDRKIDALSPTGPPPTMSTGVSSIGLVRPPSTPSAVSVAGLATGIYCTPPRAQRARTPKPSHETERTIHEDPGDPRCRHEHARQGPGRGLRHADPAGVRRE